MSPRSQRLRRLVPMVAAAMVCVLVWQLAEPSPTSAADRARLAAPFAFSPYAVSPPDLPGDRTSRAVAPVYENIDGWVSSVGASTALFNVEDGVVPHDLCLVDPRTDTVTVRPVPTTGSRYRPFTLEHRDMPVASYVAPMGCLPVDVNEDGWQDVVVYYWGRSPVIFLREPRAEPSASAFRAKELVSPPQIWNTNAATVADFDTDGHLDLFFGNYFPDGARVLDPTARQAELVMPDSLSNAYNAGTHRLFRFASATASDTPDVTFEEAHDAFDGTSTTGWTLAAGSYDLTGDGRPELYIANDFAPDQLLVNDSEPGRVRFTEVHGERHALTPKSKVLGRDSFKGMGVAFGDVDGDGTADVLVSNITEPYALQESNFAFVRTGEDAEDGTLPFEDKSEELGLSRTGWSWDVKVADFANSGAPQVMYATGFLRGTTDRWAQLQETAMSNDLILRDPALWPTFTEGADLSGHDPNRFFVRGPSGRYTDVGDLVGVGTDAVSRAFAVGDADNDGRLDFVVANQWAQSTFYRNESAAGEFLGLRLREPALRGRCSGSDDGPGRPAIGAGAEVTFPDGRVARQQLYPANGHNGVDAPELLFGLGDEAPDFLPVTVKWRNACGERHSAVVSLAPGWHELRLNPNGTVTESR